MTQKIRGEFVDEWQTDFKGHGIHLKAGPIMDRQCKDICCIVMFFLFIGAFFGIGGYCLASYNGYITTINQTYGTSFTISLISLDSTTQGPFAGTAVGMIALAILLSILMVLLTKAFPKCMVYGLIVFSILLILAVAVAGFAVQSWILGGVFVAIAAFYSLILFCCLRGHLQTSIVLFKCAGQFLSHKPQIYLVSLLMCIMTVGFSVFWAFSYLSSSSMLSLSPQSSTTNVSDYTTMWNAFMAVLWILYIFFTYFFYYSMVFLIASGVGLWYYKKQDQSMLGTAFKWYFKSAIGPITFAAIVITIIKIIKTFVNENSSNPCIRLCMCIIHCIFSALEYLVKILNHFAIIGAAFTGQGYYTSAKRAGILIFSNLGLFATVNIISSFFFYVSILVCIGIPTAISAVIVIYQILPLYPAAMFAIYGYTILYYMIGIVLIFSLITSIIFISTFTESLNSVFVYFCMDKKLAEFGICQHNAPDDIKYYLNQFNRQEKDRTQVEMINVTQANLDGSQQKIYSNYP